MVDLLGNFAVVISYYEEASTRYNLHPLLVYMDLHTILI